MDWWMNGGRSNCSGPTNPLIRQSNNPIFIGLAGIKFYNGLFVGDGLYLIAAGYAHHHALEGFLVHREPIRHGAAGSRFQISRGQLAPGIGILDFDDVIYLETE